MQYQGHEHRGSRRRRRARRRWAGIVLALLVLTTIGATRCLPQGLFSNAKPTGFSGGEPNPAAYTLVVYNENDPLSRDLADFYAKARGIDAERVVGLKCPATEEISREEYDNTIAGPLRQLFDARHWWSRTPDKPGAEPSSTVTENRIRYVALIRGIPLKVRQTQNYPGDFCKLPSPLRDQNCASVDSELALLGVFTRAISGPLNNPYYRSYSRIGEANFPGLMLVCRLDAPTGSTVRRMITDSLAAEHTGLWGRCYIDARGLTRDAGPMLEGDTWLKRVAAADGAPLCLPTVYDEQPALFSASYPMTEAAIYFGWYTENVAGPFTREDFRFQPGAVACHIHSFSAVSVQDPARYWVAPLLEKGAAAALGNVYEPYLGLLTHLDTFSDRLFDGYTLAESAYAASPALSWMTVVVGDPLYRPGRVWRDMAFDIDSPGVSKAQQALVDEGRAYLQGAHLWRSQGSAAGAQTLEKSGQKLRSGRIFEGLGSLQAGAGDTRRALAAYDQALSFYKAPADDVRVLIQEARLLNQMGQRAKAIDLLRANRQKYADSPSAAALDELAAEIMPKTNGEKP